jgi:c-di-GMP-binding flagellar brake protein YcgR
MLINEHIAVPIRKGPPRPQDAMPQIPAAANSYDMTTEDDIGDALTLLAASGDAISMYVQGTRDAVLGRIFSVDPELPHFVMELNEGSVLPPGKITFVAWVRSAKLQFRLTNQDWTSLPGQPHMIPMVFPETCAVLNRRTSERIETPLGASFMASYELNNSFHELPIFDFSLGGISLHCTKIAAKGLIKGRKLPEVQLDLGLENDLVVELEVRYTRPIRSFLLGEQLHLGCMFINLTPETEAEIKSVYDQVRNAPR